MPGADESTPRGGKIRAFIACALIVGFIAYGFQAARKIEPHFTDCTATVMRELGTKQRTVHVQAYSLTSAPIAKALVDANNRGAKVVVIADPTNRSAKYSAADFVAHEGIETYIDSQHAIAHNKIMIIDGRTVLTGSFNFTKAAEENNAENLLLIRDSKLAAQFEQNWQAHFSHSEYYSGD